MSAPRSRPYSRHGRFFIRGRVDAFAWAILCFTSAYQGRYCSLRAARLGEESKTGDDYHAIESSGDDAMPRDAHIYVKPRLPSRNDGALFDAHITGPRSYFSIPAILKMPMGNITHVINAPISVIQFQYHNDMIIAVHSACQLGR